MSSLQSKVQPTLEYFILLGLTVSLILVALNAGSLIKARNAANDFFRNVAGQIMGERPDYVNFSPTK